MQASTHFVCMGSFRDSPPRWLNLILPPTNQQLATGANNLGRLFEMQWPPNYFAVSAQRLDRLWKLKSQVDPKRAALYYRDKPAEFIEHWCFTFDPRNADPSDPKNLPTILPFVLFDRQRDLVGFLHGCVKEQQNGLIEKCRDMGATWLCCAFSVWLFLFWPGASVGWGSRKENLVDKIGDPDSIFEKMRIIMNNLPPELKPSGFNSDVHMTHMRFVNAENGSTITGEGGDNIGRGGRKLIYFKDESAHYERPEKIEAALTDNTRVQIDISSVNGLGNVFHRRREAGIEWSPGTPITKGRTNIFIMDWRDHPAKTAQWHEDRRKKAEEEGLLHLFYQEVERNYAASVEGTIIPMNWVAAAVDANKKIFQEGFNEGGWCGGLDVADSEAGDRNALAKRKGVTLIHLEEWGERDTGKTARRAVEACAGTLPIDLQYDSVGVGAGVKAETNRLFDEKVMPKGIRLIPWNAGAEVLDPEGRVVPKDKDSPINKDFYANLKAQAWWSLRRRFEKTYRAVEEGVKFPIDELICIPSTLPKLRQLEKELCQPTASKNSRMKLLIDKQPEGTRSPNLADAVVMCFFPANQRRYDSSLAWV